MKTYIKCDKAQVFVAIADERLVGLLWTHRIMRVTEERLHVAQFVVDKESRGKGIGTLLLNECIGYSRDNGIQTIDLFVSTSNNAAKAYYDNAGFVTKRLLMVNKVE